MKTALGIIASGLLMMTLPAFAADGGACKEDIQKFCGDVDASDHHAIGGCLRKHKDDVSADCKAQMAKHHKKKTDAATSTTGSATGTTTGSSAGQ